MKVNIEVGQIFYKWTVLEILDNQTVFCLCECGTKKPIRKYKLFNGSTKSCQKCRPQAGRVTHGLIRSKSYSIWSNMKNRCTNEGFKDFHLYGGKGIKVCEKWMNFEGFFEDMGERPDGLTLDRVDGNMGYQKDNCRWASPREQANNISTNRLIKYKGEEYTIANLARHVGMDYHALYSRIERGQDIDDKRRRPKSYRSLKNLTEPADAQ